MLFGLFRNRISKREIEPLQTAERSLGIFLVETYRTLSKRNRAVFLEHAERYNKEHAEYLEMVRKYGEI